MVARNITGPLGSMLVGVRLQAFCVIITPNMGDLNITQTVSEIWILVDDGNIFQEGSCIAR